ncbi:replication initiator [Streptomyces sp. NPDC006283]|uniref:replication initiator n=1 Tax=Streptomyces sp. NPDC006283 TaxID=3156741 RepID=UPI0033A4F278
MTRQPDLRHVISPAVRDLIELANFDDFDRVTEQVRNLRGCTRPVDLHGWTITTNKATKEVVCSYRSEDEPTGRLLTPCATASPPAAPPYHIIKAGLSGGKNVAEALAAGHYGRTAVDVVAPLLLLGWGTVGPQLLRHFHPITHGTDTASATAPVTRPVAAPAAAEPVQHGGGPDRPPQKGDGEPDPHRGLSSLPVPGPSPGHRHAGACRGDPRAASQ